MSDTPAIAMAAGDPARHELVTGKVVLNIGGEPTAFELTVPSGPCDAGDLLPIMRGFGNLLADRGIAAIEQQGRTISCRAGCGACCRQMVPIAQSEAIALASLVAAMPEQRRSVVVARFDAALAAIETAGMTDRISAGGTASTRESGLRYFALDIACPFLEDEACSIYADRPLVCREYLVTSPPEHCADPSPETIEMVPITASPSRALLRMEAEPGWMALVLALRRAENPPPPPARRPGPGILRAFVEALKD